MELLIDRVIVSDDQVEIRYVLPTGPGGEQTPFCHLRLDYFDQTPLLIVAEDIVRRGRVRRQVGDQAVEAIELGLRPQRRVIQAPAHVQPPRCPRGGADK